MFQFANPTIHSIQNMNIVASSKRTVFASPENFLHLRIMKIACPICYTLSGTNPSYQILPLLGANLMALQDPRPGKWQLFRIWAGIGLQSFGGGASTTFLIQRT